MASRHVDAGLAGRVAVLLAAFGLASGLVVGTQARATHERPAARGVEQACPPDRVAESPFRDIAGNPHEAAIECAAWWGVAQTHEGDIVLASYNPARAVRRDQMASFVAHQLRVAGVDVPFDAPEAFDDVDDGAHARAVNALAELGVVSGHVDGSYRPDRPVRRDQVASFVSRAAEHVRGTALTGEHRWFADVGAANPHAAAVNGLADAGVVQGRDAEAGLYGPGAFVRRDQMASVLARSLDLWVAEGHLSPPRSARAELVDADGQDVGQVRLTERVHGQVRVRASVTRLAEGLHGFHLHEAGSCQPDFAAAGGHYNPEGTAHGDHAGDLPVLPVDADGTGELTFVTDRVAVDELLADDGAAAVVHEAPDNYAHIPDRYGGPDDTTLATGDAGDRLACGALEDVEVTHPGGAFPDPVTAVAQLVDPDGDNVGGVTIVERAEDKVEIRASVTRLAEGLHGFHLHEAGSCQPDFAAAGGHYNPEGTAHGDHAGDLPVLPVDADGTGELTFVTDRVAVDELLADDGAAAVVHEAPDNYAHIPDRYGGPEDTTLATGDAGDRIACGAITPTR